MNENNLARTIELIDLCFKLKEAYLRRQHPEASPEKIRDLINQGILARKEQQWATAAPPPLQNAMVRQAHHKDLTPNELST